MIYRRTRNQSLFEKHIPSFCRGRIHKVVFTQPLEWSGKNSVFFSPQKTILKIKIFICSFTLGREKLSSIYLPLMWSRKKFCFLSPQNGLYLLFHTWSIVRWCRCGRQNKFRRAVLLETDRKNVLCYSKNYDGASVRAEKKFNFFSPPFFKTFACPRFCKRRVLFCTQVRSMGVKIPLQSTKYTRL